jgi:hypothetical protein
MSTSLFNVLKSGGAMSMTNTFKDIICRAVMIVLARLPHLLVFDELPKN